MQMRFWFAALIVLAIIMMMVLCDPPNTHWKQVQKFSAHKNKLRTGDILVLHNWGPTSRLIRFIEGTPASHTAIVVRDGDEIYVCDLDWRSFYGSDTRVKQIDEFMSEQDPICGWIQCRKTIDLTLEEVRKMRVSFDYSLMLFPFKDRLVCSEFVHRIQSRFGIKPWSGNSEDNTTPAVYWRDPSIVFLDYRQ